MSVLHLEWTAHTSMFVYRSDWDASAWIESVVHDHSSIDAFEADLCGSLEQFTQRATEMSDPDDLHLWIAHVATAPNGQMMINVTGSISFGPAVDVDEVAEEWRAAQAESAAVVAEVEVSPSRRAPVVAAREIYLVETEGGEQQYHEWGLAVRSLPRLDMSVRMEIDTPDLAAFENLTEFLIDSIRNVSLTEVEESA